METEQELMQQYEGLVRHIIHKHFTKEIYTKQQEQDDLLQEGRFALLRAIRRFDP